MTPTRAAAKHCRACDHRWVLRKKKTEYVPRQRCPNCFKLVKGAK